MANLAHRWMFLLIALEIISQLEEQETAHNLVVFIVILYMSY